MLLGEDGVGPAFHSSVGGCPRDIRQFLIDPIELKRNIWSAIHKLQNVALIHDLVEGLSSDVGLSYLSHSLVVLDCEVPFDLSSRTSLRSDPDVVRLKGDLVFVYSSRNSRILRM